MGDFKKGDLVFVWSLQSFDGGGFLNGVPGIVTQDSGKDEESLYVTVERKRGGRIEVDEDYEVYKGQVKLAERLNWVAKAPTRILALHLGMTLEYGRQVS